MGGRVRRHGGDAGETPRGQLRGLGDQSSEGVINTALGLVGESDPSDSLPEGIGLCCPPSRREIPYRQTIPGPPRVPSTEDPSEEAELQEEEALLNAFVRAIQTPVPFGGAEDEELEASLFAEEHPSWECEAAPATTSDVPVESESNTRGRVLSEFETKPIQSASEVREVVEDHSDVGSTQLDSSVSRGPVSESSANQDAVAVFEEGLEHMRRQRVAEAIDAWTRALELDPNNRVYAANLRLAKKRYLRRAGS